MPVDELEHEGKLYALQYTYAVLDDAWIVELSEAVPAPANWADIPGADPHLPGRACIAAVIPDEDPAREPTISLPPGDQQDIPFEVIRWYMEKVAEEISRIRVERPGEAGPAK